LTRTKRDRIAPFLKRSGLEPQRALPFFFFKDKVSRGLAMGVGITGCFAAHLARLRHGSAVDDIRLRPRSYTRNLDADIL